MAAQSISPQFRLYVAGSGPSSARAIRNLRDLCEVDGRDPWSFDVVDVYERSDLALADEVILTPTLVRIDCNPPRRVTGTLGDRELVLRSLGLEGKRS